MKNPQEKKDHSASEHCSLFYIQTGSSQFLMERYLTIYESCNKMEIEVISGVHKRLQMSLQTPKIMVFLRPLRIKISGLF